MTKKIVVSMPTRGEAPHLETMVKSYVEHAADRSNTFVVVSIDDDDPHWNADRIKALEGESVIVSCAPREDALGDKWNRALKACPGDVYCVATDDNGVMTQGWDDRLRAAAALFPDDCGVIYYGEGNAALPMCQAVTHGWADAFAGLYPTHFPFWFIDMWLDELAMMTDRVVWADIQVGSADGRGKTKGLRDVRFWNQFFDLTRPVRERQADLAIDEFYKDMPYMAWRLKGKGRTAMRSMFAERSKYIHTTSVEAEANQSIDAPENDRYLRIKRNAELYLQSLYSKAA